MVRLSRRGEKKYFSMYHCDMSQLQPGHMRVSYTYMCVGINSFVTGRSQMGSIRLNQGAGRLKFC